MTVGSASTERKSIKLKQNQNHIVSESRYLDDLWGWRQCNGNHQAQKNQKHIVSGARYRDDLLGGVSALEINQAQTKTKANRERRPLS